MSKKFMRIIYASALLVGIGVGYASTLKTGPVNVNGGPVPVCAPNDPNCGK